MKLVVVVASACIGASSVIALAAPAAADPMPGNYTATMIDPGTSGREAGSTATWGLAPCGTDCLHLATSGAGWDLQRQGDVWVGQRADGTSATLNNTTLIVTLVYPDRPSVTVGLATA